jgi:hypothetical protein
MEAMHQGKPLDICRRLNSFSAAPEACCARTMPPGVHALEIFRVRGVDGQIGRALQGVIVEEVAAPQGHLAEHGVARPQVLHPAQGVVVPVHHHLAAAGLVGLLRAPAGKIRALHRGGEHQRLSRAAR